MAYEYEDPNDEDELDQNGQPIAGTGGGLLTSAPGQGSAAGPTAGSDFRSPQSAGFSGFTDINAYLDANRDQTADLSQKVAGKLTEEEQSVRSDIGKAGQDADAAINSAAIRPDEALVSRATSNPADFVKNAADVEAFKKQRDATYGGPAGVADETAASLRNRISEAQRRAKGVDTESGREELLRSLNPTATKGMFTLDNMLLGADPNSRQTISAAAAPFETLGTYLDETSGTATSKADQARADADASRNLVASKLTGPEGALPGFEKDLNERLAWEQGQEQYQLDRILRGLQGYSVWRDDVGEVGANQDQLDELKAYANMLQNQYKVDPQASTYVKPRSVQEGITRQNFASQDDYANYLALADLAGIDPTFLHEEDMAQAGAYPRDFVDFDYTGLNNSVRDTLTAKDREMLDRPVGTLPANEVELWRAIAKRAGVSAQYGDGRLEWRDGGGYGKIMPDYLEQPDPGYTPPDPVPGTPYPQPTTPPGEPPDPMHTIPIWDPINGVWNWIGNSGYRRGGV